MRDGPSSLKPLSTSKKRIRKRQKKDLSFWPFDDLTTSPSKPSTASKIATIATRKAEDIPASDLPKPAAAIKTGTMATSKAQEPPTTVPTIPKERIEKHTLRVTPQPKADLKEVEKAIRSIESPCGNVVWSSSTMKKPTRGSSGAATLEINVIYNDCSRRKNIPYLGRMACGGVNGETPSHHGTLSMDDVVGRVRGLAGLVAQCEVSTQLSWTVNAVSHGGRFCAS